MRPLLTLCMIVRDEAHGIARTLQSAKPWIDRWCILDTGSTDGTPEIVEQELEDLTGDLHRAPFADFATSRNHLLALARDEQERGYAEHPTPFLLLLDADDILEGGEALRAWLTAEIDEARAKPEPDREAFFVRTRLGPTMFGSARVVRAAEVGPNGWHYEGAMHEVLVHPCGRLPTITIPGATIRHERPAESAERTRARWKRDVDLLTAEIRHDDNSPRAWFYLARTYQSLGNLRVARVSFERRIELGGWPEEVFHAKLGRAQCLDGDAQIAAFLDAAAFAPHRAEPLIELSNIYRNRGAYRLAFLFAREAHRLPMPDDVLFVDADAHGWAAADCVAISAWYCGEREIGHAAAREALDKCPPEHRERCARTLAFYESKT